MLLVNTKGAEKIVLARHHVALPVIQQDQFQLYSWHPLGWQLARLIDKMISNCVLRWSEEGARETVRLSVGRDTTKQMIDRAVDAFAVALLC